MQQNRSRKSNELVYFFFFKGALHLSRKLWLIPNLDASQEENHSLLLVALIQTGSLAHLLADSQGTGSGSRVLGKIMMSVGNGVTMANLELEIFKR
jgi:hypothetical protein